MNNKWIGLALVGCMFGVATPRLAEACGLIIPVEGETATVDAQRVTMAYFPDENRTRVMAQIGYVGDLTNFSWIIPLPSEPTAVEAVDEAGAELFAALDTTAKPTFLLEDWTCALNNGGGGPDVSVPDVQVLQHGNTGSFEYVVLTGTGGSVVTDWLNAEGFATPDGMAEVMHSYIREGSVVMAMKVNLEALELGQIDPAISFDYEGWPGYPLRILKPTTTNEVEIILNVLAPTGAVAADEVRLSNDDLSWVDQEPQYLDAIRNAEGWVIEHRGEMFSRYVEDPAGGYLEVLPPRDLIEEVFGIPADEPLVLSRFHGIFTPEQLAEDTALNVTSDAQGVFSEFSHDITRSDVDCGWDDEFEDEEDDDDQFFDDSDDDDGCWQGSCGGSGSGKSGGGAGCSTTSGNIHPVLLLLALALFRRRRRATL